METKNDLRLECLKLALKENHGRDPLQEANNYFKFVSGGAGSEWSEDIRRKCSGDTPS